MLRYIQGLTVAVLLGTAGCNVDNLLNQTASFGGNTAGQRSKFRYVIINNTPYRALFTAGAYDDLDQNTTPQFQQFGNDANGTHLEGNSTSATFQPNCARVFAIGTPELVQVIQDNAAADSFDTALLIQDVYFSIGDIGTAEGAQPTQGVAPGIEVRLGVDFACNSELIIRLEKDDVGANPFRIDFEVIPADDDRNPPT
jgi:hypothetical protein